MAMIQTHKFISQKSWIRTLREEQEDLVKNFSMQLLLLKIPKGSQYIEMNLRWLFLFLSVLMKEKSKGNRRNKIRLNNKPKLSTLEQNLFHQKFYKKDYITRCFKMIKGKYNKGKKAVW